MDNVAVLFQKSEEMVMAQDDFPEELSATRKNLLSEESSINDLFLSK